MDKLETSLIELNIKNRNELLFLKQQNMYFLEIDILEAEDKITIINTENDFVCISNVKHIDIAYVIKQLKHAIKICPRNIRLVIAKENIYVNKQMEVKIFMRCLQSIPYIEYELDLCILYKQLTSKTITVKQLNNLHVFDRKKHVNKLLVILLCLFLIVITILFSHYKVKYRTFVYFVNEQYEQLLEIKQTTFINKTDMYIYVYAYLQTLNIEKQQLDYFINKLDEKYLTCWYELINNNYEQAISCSKNLNDKKISNFITYQYIYFLEANTNDDDKINALKESLNDE